MLSVKTRPKPGSTSLAARSFSEVGLAVGRMSNVMLPMLPGAGVIFRAALSETAKETAMALSRIEAPGQPQPKAPFTPFGRLPHPALSGSPDRQDMLLPDAEVQYVCRCAARQSHGQSMAVVAAIRPSQAVLKCHRVRNDLIFRRSRPFCNIEPKICQYG